MVQGKKKPTSGSQKISQAEGSTEHPLVIIRNCQTAHRRLCSPDVFKLIYYSVLNLKDSRDEVQFPLGMNAVDFLLPESWWKREGWLDV